MQQQVLPQERRPEIDVKGEHVGVDAGEQVLEAESIGAEGEPCADGQNAVRMVSEDIGLVWGQIHGFVEAADGEVVSDGAPHSPPAPWNDPILPRRLSFHHGYRLRVKLKLLLG